MFYQIVLLLCAFQMSSAQLTAADIPVFEAVEEVCRNVTVQGCDCAASWVFEGITYDSCANPNNDQDNWCKIAPGCFGTPSGSIEDASASVPSPSTSSVFMIGDSTPSSDGEVIPGYDYGFCAPQGCVKPVCFDTIDNVADISTFVTLADATNIIGLAAGNTLLVPTNEVLDAVVLSLGFDLASLSNAELAAVFDLLQLHVIEGFLLNPADLINLSGRAGGIPTLSPGAALEVDASGATISVVGGTSSANVVGSVPVDILCNTAIIVIDAVLTAA
eukprot:TRINITY_DN37_c0_g1_i2.p1 TRINITY_DN37_c0_g1~~TRINITY_DN37_c0_g1_i2.p1  ORF type:complete len:275 (-),score=60.53 TRINITY_DN37_c0_g1_i2:753-1577(-)